MRRLDERQRKDGGQVAEAARDRGQRPRQQQHRGGGEDASDRTALRLGDIEFVGGFEESEQPEEREQRCRLRWYDRDGPPPRVSTVQRQIDGVVEQSQQSEGNEKGSASGDKKKLEVRSTLLPAACGVERRDKAPCAESHSDDGGHLRAYARLVGKAQQVEDALLNLGRNTGSLNKGIDGGCEQEQHANSCLQPGHHVADSKKKNERAQSKRHGRVHPHGFGAVGVQKIKG